MTGKIQNADIKSVSELTSPSSLPNDDKIYVTADGLNKTLKAAIEDGDIGGGGGGAITIPKTYQVFRTAGAGTYTTPVGVSAIKVKMSGGGAGGSSGSITGAGTGGAGSNTVFGGYVAEGAPVTNGSVNAVADPTDYSSNPLTYLNSDTYAAYSAYGIWRSSNTGATGGRRASASNTIYTYGGKGADGAIFGGGGSGSSNNIAAEPGRPGTGSGGGGGGDNLATSGSAHHGGRGGASGTYLEFILVSPTATYSFDVGAGGAGGTNPTNGTDGGAGAEGFIIVEEYYNESLIPFSPLKMRVYNGGGIPQSCANATYETIIFDAVNYDPGLDYNTTTGLYTIQENGWYKISAKLDFASNGTGVRELWAYLVGVGALERLDAFNGTTTRTMLAGSTVLYVPLSAGNEVGIQFYQTSGGALNALTVNTGSYFVVEKVASI